MPDEEKISMLQAWVKSIRPDRILDVGCGCGHHAEAFGAHGSRVIAIDAAPALMARWRELRRSSVITFCCMDAKAMGFASDSFPLVVERDSLHHIARWQDVLEEMLRVSSRFVMFEEPVDDLRSPEKQRTYEAQDLFLRLQAEVGYAHYRHLDRTALLSEVHSRAVIVETHLARSDHAISFGDFFASFDTFAARSGRETYWLEELEILRSRFGGLPLCEDDRLMVLAEKKTESDRRIAS